MSSKSYDLDFDNQFIPCEKYDSKKSYKMKRGYYPGVLTIGKNIVYLENRNGNSNVKYKQAYTLEATYKLIKDKGIKINRSRMGCGSFTQDVVQMVEKHSQLFYIRAQRCPELTAQIKTVTKWVRANIGFKEVEICSIDYKPFGKDKS